MCFTSEGAIFLDVKNDRYVGLGKREAETLRQAVDAPESVDQEAKSLLDDLIRGGLICSPCEQSRPFEATSPLRQVDTLIDDPEQSPAIKLVHARRFAAACLSVGLRFRFGSLQQTIDHVSSSKARLIPTPVDLARARELCLIFMHLRPFLYTAREHCLFDSLVLADFLRRFGINAMCVFGVSTLPFAAHCWVQIEQSLAIEQSAEEMAMFAPILVV